MNKSIFNTNKWSIKKTKLAILVPTRDMIHAATAMSLANLIKFNTLRGIDSFLFFDASTVLLTQRERLALEAQSLGAEYMLWIDSDMVVPDTTAVRLMSHNEPVVAANYVKRQPPYKGVAYEIIGDWQNPLAYEPQDSLVPVEGIGMGCMLMKTEILAKLPRPWFEFGWTKDSNDWLGEDMIFCQKMSDAGFVVKVDTQLSMETHHMGTYAFNANILK